MNIKFKGIIVTAIVIIFGILLLLPVYLQRQAKPNLMLSFDIVIQDNNILKWCEQLSKLIENNDIKSTVFITGKLAEENPKCISQFVSDDNIDIGSSTYNYRDLTAISNYTEALEEVRNGKRVIDGIGNIDSKIFKSPFGKTDQNIYSFLNRTGITFDLSYHDKYNTFENNLFIKHNLKALNGSNTTSAELNNKISTPKDKTEPILINFDNSVSIDGINNLISEIRSLNKEIVFTNPSDLIKQDLTIKMENKK
jgi:peptidoglycan/xylan/chitin deacetylase (PgdA/CDA1 family)